MKRFAMFLLAGVLCLGLTGCAGPLPPEKAADGQNWNEDWVTVGQIIGVDTPEGMDPRENNEALAANGMYYATWSMGEAVPCVNEDGEDAELYGAQVYLLLSGGKSAEEAENILAQWQELAKQRYVVGETDTQTHNGQEFTIITYTFDSESNPYARGVSAYGVYRNYAVNVELACQEDFDIDPEELMGQFLDNCHYAMP